MKKILLLIILSFVNIVNAQEIESVRFENIVKTLKLNKSRIKNEFCTEKKMPNAEDSYIVVIPVLVGEYEEDFFTIKNYILITDEKGNIKNQYLDPREITSDAIRLYSMVIDTGLYTIGSNIRAFGLKVIFEGSSRPNPYSSEDISLYYPVGKTFKKVLNEFNLSSSSGEWDTNCAGEFEDETSVIMLDKTKTNNFTDLKIKTKITATINKVVNDDCKNEEKVRTTFKTLKFTNGIYK
jgi:hypothetical protein